MIDPSLFGRSPTLSKHLTYGQPEGPNNVENPFRSGQEWIEVWVDKDAPNPCQKDSVVKVFLHKYTYGHDTLSMEEIHWILDDEDYYIALPVYKCVKCDLPYLGTKPFGGRPWEGGSDIIGCVCVELHKVEVHKAQVYDMLEHMLCALNKWLRSEVYMYVRKRIGLDGVTEVVDRCDGLYLDVADVLNIAVSRYMLGVSFQYPHLS